MRLGKDRKLEYLSAVPLFAGLSKKELGTVAATADEVHMPEGSVLITEGTRGREFFVLIDGTAAVTRKGRKVRTMEAGSWFGEIALIAHVPRTATVTTTSASRLLVVTDRAFEEAMTEHPSIAVKVLSTVGERLAEHQTSV